MNEIQAGPNDLLDTTDCLEAVGVFKGWKNFFFIIIALCLLLLQGGFWLVDRGCINLGASATAAEQGSAAGFAAPQIKVLNVPVEKVPPEGVPHGTAAAQPPKPVVVEPNKPKPLETPKAVQPEVAQPKEPAALAEPNKAAEPNKTAAPAEPAEPNKAAEPNRPIDPNLASGRRTPYGPTPGRVLAEAEGPVANLERAITWPSVDFLSQVTAEQFAWALRLINAVLVLTASLYCLTLLFGLKVSMHGRLGGINHISRAFFLSLLMLVLLLPWQKVFGGVVTGAIYTPAELIKWRAADKSDDVFQTVLYYLRFSGYGVLVLLLLILSQYRSLRWAKAILRRLEII
jgi:hypothetical protein